MEGTLSLSFVEDIREFAGRERGDAILQWLDRHAPSLGKELQRIARMEPMDPRGESLFRLYKALADNDMPEARDMFLRTFDDAFNLLGFDNFAHWIQLTWDAGSEFLFRQSLSVLLHRDHTQALARFPVIMNEFASRVVDYLEEEVTSRTGEEIAPNMYAYRITTEFVRELIRKRYEDMFVEVTPESTAVMDLVRELETSGLTRDTASLETLLDIHGRVSEILGRFTSADEGPRKMAVCVRQRVADAIMDMAAPQSQSQPGSSSSSCAKCGMSRDEAVACGKTIRRCSGCKSARYCSVECQKADRKSHRPHCMASSAARR